jgi:predicted nuclease of predicted toxin-antitoxin system
MPPASDAPQWRFLVDENLPARLTGYLRNEGYKAEHAYDVGLRTRPDTDVFAYARAAGATLITQDHDLERDTGQFPPPHPGVILIELPQDWPCEHKMQRILAALRSLAGQPLENTLVIVEPSQTVVRRH